MAERLNVKAWAITGGVIWGTYLFLFPFFIMFGFRYYWFSSEAFFLARSIYPGLAPTIVGAFIGLIHGAICGAFCAGLFAWVHNKALQYLQ
jgi:hypothetical protein